MRFGYTNLNVQSWGIFKFVESIFLLGILINLFSYIVRFVIIYRNDHTRIFFRTLKEGFSRKILVSNSLNLSLLITSFSVFWYMLKISEGLKILSIHEAYKHNPLITIYILFASILLFIYSLVLSIRNVLKIKELTPALGYLSFWNSADNLFNALGGGVVFKPFTDMSTSFRKYLIQTKLSEVLVSALVLVILEYAYKILVVLALLYLIQGKIL